MDLKLSLAEALTDARRRTEELLAPIDDARLMAQHDPLMSPLVWDYGHIGVFEELWLVQRLSGAQPSSEERMRLYDAFENPRRIRGQLPLMSRAEALAYRDVVRGRALDILEETEFDENDPLLREAFVYPMIVQHEHQHCETILQTLQLMRGGYLPLLPSPPAGRPIALDMVHVPAGRYAIGTDQHAPYDNEHPRFGLELPDFSIDRFPVTNAQFLQFIEDGGYARRELWSAAGQTWLRESGATAPKHWRYESGGWLTDRFGHVLPVAPDEPVIHVCFHEAEAYARWAGKRLPTEFEWEVAACWDPKAGQPRIYPWGDAEPTASHANLDQHAYGPAAVGSYPDGASAFGCEQTVGDVWEWTSSDFLPYPGFVAFPYPEYSEVFFGPEYKVLRGASWAARPSVARATFRNWDYPIRRQIFAGFRCAKDEK